MSDERTDRGFRIFLNEYEAREGRLTVLESSLAFEGPHVRIYQGDTALHLSLADAHALTAGLGQFITESEAGELTEPPDEPDA